MKRYLVISFDSDEQQWFYDTVFAKNEEDAKRRILDIRPYVMDADAIDLPELRVIARNMRKRTRRETEAHLQSIAKESGVEASQTITGRIKPSSPELQNIRPPKNYNSTKAGGR